jgi:subtilase family serine protease
VSRQRWVAGLGATATVASLTIVGFAGSAGATPQPGYTRLAGSVAPFTAANQAIGAVNGSVRLSIQVWLKTNLTGAENYASAVSTPGSKLFGHFLSPDAFTSKFGASGGETAKVESWLRSQGFSGVAADSQRDYVRATGSVSAIDAAFKVKMDNYRSTAQATAGQYTLRSNSGPVAIPASLSSSVLGVTGLDNARPVLPLETPTAKPDTASARKDVKKASTAASAACSAYYGQHVATGLPKQFGTTRFPTELCGYTAPQLRAAYGASFKNNGKDQTVALIELGLTQDMFLTLKDYAHRNKLPAPSTHRYSELSLGQGTMCGDEFDVEEQLDVEASYAMAPHVNQLVVGGDSCNNGDMGLQGLFDADLAVINGSGHHPLATIASNSWEGSDEEQDPTNTAIETDYLVRAAAVGVGMYFSSGDGSGVEAPSDNPYAIAVGGTTLGISKTDTRLFETGWSTGESFQLGKHWIFEGEQGADGGGPSLLWKQPGYQKGVVPAKLAKAPGNRGGRVRSVPDISADADPFTGMAVGLLNFPADPSQPPTYFQTPIGGTSESSPLVAGIIADAQQGQHHAFGFINPVLYKLFNTRALHQPLPLTSHSKAAYRGVACDAAACGIQVLTTFDDQSQKMFGYTGQVTLRGYNNMTGIGTPHGQNFIDGLRKLER